MSNDYKPVSCATHSEYELAIMHKQVLSITSRNKDGIRYSEEVVPLDIITREKAEYLVFRDQNGVKKEKRLDKIIEALPKTLITKN